MINYLNTSVIPGIDVGKNKPHHGKLIFITVAILILAGAVVFYALYYKGGDSRVVPQNMTAEEIKLAQLKALMDNPTATLTPEQIKAKQDILKMTNPTAALTPEQIKAKQDILKMTNPTENLQ